jgi:hypothetical protein
MGTIRHGAEVSLYDFGPTPLFAFEQAALALSAAVTAPALVKTRKAVIEAFGWPSQGSDSMKRNAIRCVDGLSESTASSSATRCSRKRDGGRSASGRSGTSHVPVIAGLPPLKQAPSACRFRCE